MPKKRKFNWKNLFKKKAVQEEPEKKIVWTVDPTTGYLSAQNLDPFTRNIRVRCKDSLMRSRYINLTRKSSLLDSKDFEIHNS